MFGSVNRFSNIAVGEIVYIPGHVGVYIGNNLVVECSPSWKNCVQITAIAKTAGYNTRRWNKHGKLPYIDYSDDEKPVEKPVENVDNFIDVDEIAKRVINGDFGNGGTRKQKLGEYFYKIVQNRVNELCK